jgi:hypothetical protein
MAEHEYIEKLCIEKHATIKEAMSKMENNINEISRITREAINGLHKKINGFYVLAIATLAATLFDIVKNLVFK